uniref:Uncharacterized protein n=1 Tax=Physcomitrium patens TaxID=3218 RepID=A0A2K1IVS6_PHYPA|nr:predicted GPI-anchored protein 58 [Physcomitrium patens]PNR33379.1 hypothetical protein PHYPA_025323 [Physcomitrium patens]|eukprot:XP_024357164.1 predicted GPI-anchored protein 58 [Physcomitrella patens]
MECFDLGPKRMAQSIIYLLLLTLFSSVLAIDSQSPNFICGKSCRCPLGAGAQDRADRKLAALSPPSEAPASAPLPPAPPPNKRPALITPNANLPDSDLPPLRTPPSPGQPAASPVETSTSPVSSKKQTNVAVGLGVALGVFVVLIVSISAAAYFKPDWMPCCKETRRSYYERQLPT